MKSIPVESIIEAVENLCIKANYHLNEDVREALEAFYKEEESDVGMDILQQILQNAEAAKAKGMAMCQDTGMAVIFVELGQDVHIEGGSLEAAIQEGVRRGYSKGYLRNSVVRDPIHRINTGDNSPAVIHFSVKEGSNLKITVAPKGFGSENMSALRMLKPSDGIEGVKKFILETISNAGPNPCPPIIVGVGIGGTMEKAALMAKQALLRPVNQGSEVEYIRALEQEMLEKANRLGIGPGGLGGRTTALGVNIEVFPTHIAGLPVAVNISCHATRHAEVQL